MSSSKSNKIGANFLHQNKTILAECLMFFLIILILYFNYFTLNSDQYKYFNSDALMIYEFWKDINLSAGSVSAWHYSNAPNFFPDYFIGLLAFFLAKDVFIQIFISSIIQIIILYIAIRQLAKNNIPNFYSLYAQIIFLIIIYFASKDVTPYFQVLILNWHFGTYIASLYCILIYQHLILNKFLFQENFESSKSIVYLIFLCILSWITTLSDSLFLVIASAPFLAVGLFYLVTKRLTKFNFLVVFLLPFLCSILGKLTAPYLVPNFGNISIQFSFNNSIEKIIELTTQIIHLGIIGLYLLIFTIFSIYKTVIIITKKNIANSVLNDNITFLLVFFCCSLGASFVAIIFTNSQYGDRYFPAIFFTPLVFSFILILLFKVGHKILLASAAAMITILLINVSPLVSKPLQSEYYPQDVACIDQVADTLTNPTGIAQYWLVKKTTAFSKRKIRLSSVNPDLTPYKVLISDDWYKAKPNFAIISTNEPDKSMYKLNEETLRNYNDKPDSIHWCNDLKILIYKNGLETVSNLNKPNRHIDYKACQLPVSTGTVDAVKCSLKSNVRDYSGNLTYGPYLKLNPGIYEFDLSYISANPVTQVIGYIDTSFLFPEKNQTETVNKKYLTGTSGELGHARGGLIITDANQSGAIEIRTFIEKNTEIELLNLRFVRSQ